MGFQAFLAEMVRNQATEVPLKALSQLWQICDSFLSQLTISVGKLGSGPHELFYREVKQQIHPKLAGAAFVIMVQTKQRVL